MARRLRQEASEGLGPSRVAALASISRHGPLTPSELARVEAIQRPTATRLIAHLEDAGLIDRSADPDDGRSCLVAITRSGEELLAEMRARKTAYLARSLAELDAADRETLDRAAHILEGMLAGETTEHRAVDARGEVAG
ncbi:MarR family transcriptional regulator [Thermoleophilia bacterium SCSIO 60948]|nr:MarR family transcriptional regulator [Thermoleophilia bacterium SCSIO 60948]